MRAKIKDADKFWWHPFTPTNRYFEQTKSTVLVWTSGRTRLLQ